MHIVSSKACQAFATRAAHIVAAVTSARPGIQVTVDAQPPLGRKPDRGSFIVTVGSKSVVNCTNIPRPFAAMKALDLDIIVATIIGLL